jgi:hypothetical protein
MLGKLYASFSLNTFNFWIKFKDSFFLVLIQFSFYIVLNLEVSQRKSATYLNYGESLFFSFSQKNSEFLKEFPHTFFCDKNELMNDNPVPKPIAPRQLPGVYMILCVSNNKRYFGQSKNVSARLSQHKSRLRRNIHEIPELQQDFNLYCEKNFEFSVVSISKNFPLEERLALETQLVEHFPDLCYNKFSKGSRKRENNPFWNKKHTEETIKQISISLAENRKNSILEGFQIVLEGVIYPSISEASRQTNHSRHTIRRWLNDPKNNKCIPSNMSQPFDSQDILVANTGKAKSVNIYGIVYPSIAEAARQRNCSGGNIQRLLRNHSAECFIIEN